MGELDPALRQIPEEIHDLIAIHTIPGLAFLSCFVTSHRFPSNEELEHAIQNVYAKQKNLESQQQVAA